MSNHFEAFPKRKKVRPDTSNHKIRIRHYTVNLGLFPQKSRKQKNHEAYNDLYEKAPTSYGRQAQVYIFINTLLIF